METKQTQCHPKPLVNATCLLGEKGCYENGQCHYIGSCEHKVLTNADRIRAMTDDGLAAYLLGISTAECPFKEVRCDIYTDKTCAKCWEDWLKDPVKGDLP